MKRPIIIAVVALAVLAVGGWLIYLQLARTQNDKLILHGNVDIRQANLGFRVTGRHPASGPIAKTHHMPAQGFKPQPILHQPEEPLKTLAQIGRSNGEANPGRRSKSEHRLKILPAPRPHDAVAPRQNPGSVRFAAPWLKSLLIRSNPPVVCLGLTRRHRLALPPPAL